MADPVVAPAAPAPVAPVLKSNETMVPFEIGNMSHESIVDDEPVMDEGATDTQEVAPVEVTKPTRLAKFKNPDGTLNEDLIEQVERAAEEAGAVASEIQRAYNSDPVYRLNYIKWRQSTGQVLTPEQHAELAAAKPTEPVKPEGAALLARVRHATGTEEA